jgi:NADH-quinone oxidoreductase subunit I
MSTASSTNNKASRFGSHQEPLSLTGYLRAIATGFLSLLQGMGLTISYLVDPRKVVTRQYPENRDTLTLYPRFRARLVMIRDANGAHRCTACGLCEKACPNGTISMLTTKDGAGKKMLGKYIYRLSQCTLCNLCVETCPFGAIEMSGDFELAAYDRESLILELFPGEGQS